MTTTEHEQRRLWLAGWYTLPAAGASFASPKHDEVSWGVAAAWLRSSIHRYCDQWAPSPVATVYVGAGAVITAVEFDDASAFVEWACAHRQEQGVWGRDSERCYYIIPSEAEAPPPWPLPDDATQPLDLSHLLADPAVVQ